MAETVTSQKRKMFLLYISAVGMSAIINVKYYSKHPVNVTCKYHRKNKIGPQAPTGT
jgi:hypothetical protein